MRLKMSLLHLPSIAYLTVTERPQAFAESGLAPFDKCTVYIGDTLAMTAYAIAVEPHVDKAGHQVSLVVS
jgi:prophage tail gpP-like protein